ncbi:MAG: cation diffusion facilitator family transporter [Nitrosopumilus sp.]|nr:cation diffusion facilitator family transporter [Nitrosopumilus sp.]
MAKGNDNDAKRSPRESSGQINNNDNHGEDQNVPFDSVSLLKEKHREKTRVALTSIIASAGLTISKFIVAIATGSLGILSEALHSGLDIIAAIMTLYAIRMAMRPPDLEHHYGYAKFESLTSLGETILLFVVAGWIFYEGIERILFIHSGPEITVFSFAIMIVSIVINFNRSRALYRIARKYGSQALEADALHFKADMLTSGVVLVGLAVVYLFGIPNADSYAAITVAGVIVYTSLGLGRRTLEVLLDKAPKGIQGQILESVTGFEGVKTAHSVRVRKVGSETFVDLHIEVPRIFTHDKAHRIATNVENKIKEEILPNSDVVVHVDAVEDDVTETIKDKIRLMATNYPAIKNIHSLYLSTSVQKESENSIQIDSNMVGDDDNLNPSGPSSLSLRLYLDVQIDSNLDLNAAHDIIDDFERKIQQEVPSIRAITTHIETEVDIETSIGKEEKTDQSFIDKIKGIALSVKGVSDCKDVALVFAGKEIHITLTIKLNHSYVKMENNNNNNNNNNENMDKKSISQSNKLSVGTAHQIATDIQNLILKNTGASRVIIHTEPEL